MRDYLAQLGNIKPTAEFSLIELLGEDLPGAVQVVPLEAGHGPSLAETAEEDHGRRPYRFSLAGVQLKFSAIAERHGGLTIPARGIGGDWIILHLNRYRCLFNYNGQHPPQTTNPAVEARF